MSPEAGQNMSLKRDKRRAVSADGKAPRKKRFSTRARTGCITCRIRRVKCDEKRPSCCRCTSTGRKCDGYPAPAASEAGQIVQSPPYRICSHKETPAERHALYMFRSKIAMLIGSDTSDADFWNYDLLQFARVYQPVRLAVAALAAAYQVAVLSEQGGTPADTQFALAQYTNSISALHQCLGTGKVCTRLEQTVVLITNQLFIYLCSLLELHSEATLHLQNGLALIHEWKLGMVEERSSQAGHGITPTTVNFVLAAYARLDTRDRPKPLLIAGDG